MNTNKSETLVFALGGLGEIGKNTYVVEHENEIIIIDAGVMFPEDSLLGVDYVLADYSYLKQNYNKIKALIITHGHEDHIGGIPFLVQDVNIPVIYAPKIAAKLIKYKLEDRNVNYKNIVEYDESTVIKTQNFTIDFFATTHSIPDSFGMRIKTPNGVIVETGDFKFDLTPIGPIPNIQKMAQIGQEGVDLLMSDSTNALVEGFSKSESAVDETLGDMFAKCDGRIILATFASNIYRLTHIIQTAKDNNRKVAIFGRSMKNNIDIAIECKYIKDKDIFISPQEANKLPPQNVLLLCTGSQGEPLAALSRIANGSDKSITLMPYDTIIFSSSPIPGNAQSINRIINKLYLKGAKVYTNETEGDVHTSGHAKQEELKLMLRLISPKHFFPVHGEYRMLRAHQELGISCDIDENNIFILENGDILSLKNGIVTKKGRMPINDIYVDGNRIGDISASIIKERKIMSTDGVLAIILNIDSNNKTMPINPNVTTRGFVIVNENAELISKIESRTKIICDSELEKENFNFTDLKNKIILDINSYIIEETGRRPLILPIILLTNKPQ